MSLPVALGLFTVRDLYQSDFDACMRKTAALGYTGVECFGKPHLPAQEVLASLQRHGLTLVGWHTPIESLEGDAFDETIKYYQDVGCTRVIVPYMPPETFESRAGIMHFAQQMNAIQARLAPLGMALGYHNHAAEFLPLEDGTLPWTLLMDNTNILAQLDNGNALESNTPGLDINCIVAQWPGRAATIHVKPYSHETGLASMIGKDATDWSAYLYAAEHTGGTEWLIVEYEADDMTQFEGAAECIHALEAFN